MKKVFSDYLNRIKMDGIQYFSEKNIENGKAILSIDEKKYNFEFNLTDFKIINKMVEQDSGDIFTFEQILEKRMKSLPNVERNQWKEALDVEKFLVRSMPIRLEKNLINIRAKEFVQEIKVNFNKFQVEEEVMVARCEASIFNKCFNFKIAKTKNVFVFEIFDIISGDFDLIDKWFVSEMEKRNKNIIEFEKKNQYNYFRYGFRGVIEKMLIIKLKDDKHFKMLNLYDPNIRKLFH